MLNAGGDWGKNHRFLHNAVVVNCYGQLLAHSLHQKALISNLQELANGAQARTVSIAPCTHTLTPWKPQQLLLRSTSFPAYKKKKILKNKQTNIACIQASPFKRHKFKKKKIIVMLLPQIKCKNQAVSKYKHIPTHTHTCVHVYIY